MRHQYTYALIQAPITHNGHLMEVLIKVTLKIPIAYFQITHKKAPFFSCDIRS
jgi:hypothetical protein